MPTYLFINKHYQNDRFKQEEITMGGEYKMKYSRITGIVEIYFDDLSEEAKKIFLEAMGMNGPEEGNYDDFPIAEVPIPEEDIEEE